MKKIFSLSLFILLIIILSACGLSNEYRLSDKNLHAEMIDDNYRVYYEIFVASFSDSNKDGIGDLKGLIKRLDYLNDGNINSGKSLGVTGIWLMPIMSSPSYHKYDVTDYKSIDKSYGTMDDFERLIKEAKARSIDIIIDLVINHTSSSHPWFKAAKKALNEGDLNNPYLEYYSLVKDNEKVSGRQYHSFTQGYYYEGNFSPSMPELNMDSSLVREEIVDIIQFWFNKGVKGFRLDATKYIYFGDTSKNLDFWAWFVSECRKIKEDCYIVGETWSADNLIAPYYKDLNNFDFGMSGSLGAVASTVDWENSVNSFVNYLNSYRNMIEAINPNAILQPFLSNHDMNRAAGFLSLETFKMQMASSMYIWTYGTPFIYYGEEIGLKGLRGSEQTDANRRLKMLWGDNDTVKDPIGATYSLDKQTNGTVKMQIKDKNSLYNHYKKLIMLRNANPEIARGKYTVLRFDDYYFFGGFLSTFNNSTIGIFHNTGEEEIVIDLSKYTTNTFSDVRGYVGLGKASLNGQVLRLSPMTSVILK